MSSTMSERKTGRSLGRAFLLLLLATPIALISTARADEPRGLVTIGMQRVFDRVMPALEAASGRKFRIEYASTIDIVQRVTGGKRADFVVASRAGVDKLIAAQKVAQDSQFDLGGSRIVVAVPTGRTAPDISNVEAVRRALLAAKNVSYTDPASGGPSGIHMARVLERLGISGQVNAKTHFPPTGGFVGEILARSEADIGIQQSVELTSYPGADVVGPLPPEMQVVTDYVAAMPKDADHPDGETAVVNFLRSPECVRLLRQGGSTRDETFTGLCRRDDMDAKQLLVIGASVLAAFSGGSAVAEDVKEPYVRLAEIEIDPAQLEPYKAAVREQIEAAVRLEPGVLALYSVADNDNSAHVYVFEMYANVEAYKAHLETAHFMKYKTTVQNMVKSLKLRDTVPILLRAKSM